MSWFLAVLCGLVFLVLVAWLIYRSTQNDNLPNRGGGGGSRPPADDKRTVR